MLLCCIIFLARLGFLNATTLFIIPVEFQRLFPCTGKIHQLKQAKSWKMFLIPLYLTFP